MVVNSQLVEALVDLSEGLSRCGLLRADLSLSAFGGDEACFSLGLGLELELDPYARATLAVQSTPIDNLEQALSLARNIRQAAMIVEAYNVRRDELAECGDLDYMCRGK